MAILNNIVDKSFISFNFDGKSIEDFGMTVVSNGDRLSTSIHPAFNNTISTVAGRTGSIYWGTDITGLSFTFNLATDGMSSRQLMNFKNHFKPGKIAKFSLAESEYCYAYAIINSSSTFEFIPFDTTVKINGIEYLDTLYKGEATLNFYVPDVYFYSDDKYIFADDCIDKPWMIASGLPFRTSISQENCFLANGILLNKKGLLTNAYDGGGASSTISNYDQLINSGYSNSKNNIIINCLYSKIEAPDKRVYAYNAGNVSARTNICFTKIINFISGLSVPWDNITVGSTIINKPRMFKDIDYTLSLLSNYTNSWNENKTKILIDLRNSLDSGLRDELIGIVNATGEGLQWNSVSSAIAQIRNIIDGKQFTFSINGIEIQNIMSATLNVHNFNNPITETTQDFVENIGDVTNGLYTIIEPSEGINMDGTVTVQPIELSEIFSDIKVYFLNTYLV